jgi:hypothetical protein
LENFLVEGIDAMHLGGIFAGGADCDAVMDARVGL